jgi:hypothetical protein
MKTTKDIEMEVMEVHNLFWESYALRDIELRFSLCSEDVTFIGSGLHERALNKTEYKNINNEGVKQFPDPFQIEFLWTNLSMINEIVACVESEVVWSQMINNDISTELLRNTTLLKYDNSKWLVTHVHGSVPDYRLKDGDYMTNEQTIIRNKELERQVFERTQDLNKTLEKLEEKNRELEIEASLEKVRTIAMGMREPADMLDVCKTISIQLQSLGVKEIRNVQTAIFYEQRGTYMNYEFYAKHDKIFITETTYTNHEIHNAFATKMLRGKGETFITHIKGDEVKDWIEYQKTTNVFIDKYLETASSLNYYWFSLGPVALGISTYIPLAEDEINLFKRFLKVFELAYQRYLDIEKAIAQAKEAKIEAALEKVRAVAMSMNKPDDLLNICEVLYKEFQKLGFGELRNAMINIHNDEKGTFVNYDYSDEIGKSINHLTYNIHPVIEKQIKQIRSANDAFSETSFTGKDLEEWKKFRNKIGEKDDLRIDEISALYYYFYSIGTGSIGISTFISINVEKLELLKRFRNVFSLSYQRYSDIALAEAQAREAQIELALERVRARTMAMQKSEELKEVIQIVNKQFVHLNIIVEHSGFIMDYKERDDMHIWLADPNQVPFQITIPYFDSPHWNSFLEAKEKRKDFFANHLSFEEKNKFYQDLFKLFHVPDDAKEYYFSCPGLAISTVLLENVGLYIENFSGIPYTDEENNILMRFGNVFQQSYTRFLDLQKAEAQAREAQIEVALERVRSKALAMYNTNDLSQTVSTFFKELRSLNVLPWRCGVGQINEETKTTFLTTTSNTINGESFEVRGTLQQEGHPVLDGIFEHWKLQKEFYPVLQGDEIRKYYEIIRPQIAYPKYPLDAIQYGHFIFIKEGFVFAWTENKLSEGELGIFRRFASVLSLTYRRYLDLKEAEEQNRIIQADNERKTKELEEARQLQLSLLPKELPKLPNLDIAVYMKTASEVGGDYYDFIVDDDGTLTVAIGDATGHGMKAGTIVSMIKALFASGGSHLDIKTFFNQSSAALKGIELGRLMMAFIMLKIKVNKLAFANAGMPSLFIYRNKISGVEETMLHGMPLGAMKSFPYEIKETEISSGDTILLMSDGLPELKNEKNEQYDYARVKEEFKSAAEKSPNEIVEYMKSSASKWSNGIEPDDDVTFVVIKIK